MLAQILKRYLDYRGWSTNRKLVIFEVDDYGWSNYFNENDTAIAAEMNLPPFVKYDRIATVDELDQLFNVLSSVKDKNGRPAVFSPMTVTGNPDFIKIKDSNFKSYYSEPFTTTFQRNYGNMLIKKWESGIHNGLFMPEFHGREHLHVSTWLNALSKPNSATRKAFDNGVYTFSVEKEQPLNRKFGATYSFADTQELASLKHSLIEGVRFYEQTFKQKPSSFTPPAGGYSYMYEELLSELGLNAISLGRSAIITGAQGINERKYHFLGQEAKSKLKYIPRNCLFEPHNKNEDAVERCMRDVVSAFKRKKPAIISSHRINFVNVKAGYNGSGLLKLEKLLSNIVTTFIDAEFISTKELIKIMDNK